MNVDIKPLEEGTLSSDSINTARAFKQSKRITGDSVLNYINIHPGIRYRELLRLSGFGNGVLSYHLLILERKGKIRVHRIRNKMTRYYLTQIPDKDTKMLSFLKNNMARQLVLYILNHDMCSFNSIVECSGKAPSTISWHLNRLRDTGIISVEAAERSQLYTIVNKKEVKKILSRYKQVFMDKSVDTFVEMINQL
ncbi:MAG TPA: ArsR family transcriptional regulator [Nitrososphaeraceae archaeon]|jgi:predicted transcriptional regulator